MITLASDNSYFNFDMQKALRLLRGEVDWLSLRLYNEKTQVRSARNTQFESSHKSFDFGVMIEVLMDGHFGYAGTSDLSNAGLERALQKAKQLAHFGAKNKIYHFDQSVRPAFKGTYISPRQKTLDSESTAEFIDKLIYFTQKLKVSSHIVQTEAMGIITECEISFASTSGADIYQNFLLFQTNLKAVAQKDNEFYSRSDKGGNHCQQAGLEFFDKEAVALRCELIGQQAAELVSAKNCPTEKTNLLLSSDQMYIQIHESIGHPLELDRILGDERNYAGWSFVKPQDFGQLKYGSDLMNITFDPSFENEFASYGFDDGGNRAEKKYLIKEGTLLRGLGSLESQARLGMDGVANFRSASWNRAPIDRMANINLEAGQQSFAQILAGIEKGIYMETNTSWSIDDYRNKFQFGCEYGRLIENGKLTTVVKNPNYRGKTVEFWNSLSQVSSAVESYGTPTCGKGEPSQVIRVGHSSPQCLFKDVEVFGGV